MSSHNFSRLLKNPLPLYFNIRELDVETFVLYINRRKNYRQSVGIQANQSKPRAFQVLILIWLYPDVQITHTSISITEKLNISAE